MKHPPMAICHIKRIPKTCDPLVKDLFRAMLRLGVTYGEVADESGVAVVTIAKRWRRGGNPSLNNFRAVAEALGYKLVLQRNKDDHGAVTET